MGYGYGIQQCRETLILLTSEKNIEDRIYSALSEIQVIESDDVSAAHFKKIKEWCIQVTSFREFYINLKGDLIELDKIEEMSKLAIKLVWLCVTIIEHNSRITKKQDL